MERVFNEKLVYFLRGDWSLLIRVGLKEAETWSQLCFLMNKSLAICYICHVYTIYFFAIVSLTNMLINVIPRVHIHLLLQTMSQI